MLQQASRRANRYGKSIIRQAFPVPLTPRAQLQRHGWRAVWLLFLISLLLHLLARDFAALVPHALYALVVLFSMSLDRLRPGWGVGLFFAALPPVALWLAQRHGTGWTLSPDLAGYSAALILPAVALAVRFDFPGVVVFLGYALLLGALNLPFERPQLAGVIWNALLTLVLGWYFAWLLRYADQVVLELHRSAFMDTLTGLPNRRAFDLALDQGWSQERAVLAVVLLDLDRLKMINDTRGHVAGDRLLRQFGQALQAELGPQEVAFRLGGDEYAVLGTAERVQAISTGIRGAITAVQTIGFPEASVSVGTALAAEAESIGALFRLADERLYAEKRGKPERPG
ncbi:GGDEF domain-containing protein (plasmid) [Deinococcus metallilatus]|uniref:Diguanylate cyclase (GGDEF)-like protein n=1 Tax=Deinococcus metallilatus TaxID=1211322 RepID=A0AAJ5JZP0_9DEIO|nr:GGDEF domain-containing protein [Deinococcus metallilatus]MBB5297276.1 diguanylate cyclase (GGDEF)-like protein [Deinococcus metallilatus]QBY06977.1 GGDEF domain-containing protein [Deinococcus metallilatus]TLK31924.1 GGDEF domain-containing protein [Deinococcus metallilatus]GMA17160.1 hypothetical protein GCM10025871_34910 [Deinococcus metallilatus]